KIGDGGGMETGTSPQQEGNGGRGAGGTEGILQGSHGEPVSGTACRAGGDTVCVVDGRSSANNDVAQREIPVAKQETAALARRFSTSEILKRIRWLEELRDQLGRNVHEGLAIEVAFLTIFTA